MFRNYLKIAWRNLLRNKVYSAINIGGLAVGMAVAMLIGLWLWDELSFNKYHQHYDRIAQVMQNKSFNGEIRTQSYTPFLLGTELRRSYGSDFRYVVMATETENHILTFGEKKFTKAGAYIEPQAPELLSLKMIKGTRTGLQEPASILLSESVAKTYFGETDPMGRIIRLDGRQPVKVTGIYEDFPHNSAFRELSFMAPLELITAANNDHRSWDNNSLLAYVALINQADFDNVSTKIRHTIASKLSQQYTAAYKPDLFLHPMSKWHLYSEFKNGVNVGGLIQFVWLFSIIGVFVLLLACINFMNLSTARSEKRAKEVGIRKAVGSVRGQLISQFFSESFLVVGLAFGLALGLVLLSLNWFNQVADKQMAMPWLNPYCWLVSLGFVGLTGLLAGSYPAFYLSGFQPIKVLKGTFRAGRFSGVPRRVLVVVQFTVSVALIIGTFVVFQQIKYARNRPIGYNRAGLLVIETFTPDIHRHLDAVRQEMKQSGTVAEVAESGSPLTQIYSTTGDFEWKGKSPNQAINFRKTGVSPEYGRTVGWQFNDGRDFSPAFSTDSSGMVLNEAAIKFMGLKNPVGEQVKWREKSFKIIGVISDMVIESPYAAAIPALFYTDRHRSGFVFIKLKPTVSPGAALHIIETIFKKYAPADPFNYKFADQEYAKKFGDEERIGKLASVFAVLAIFISCLGLFGLASFMAESRTKEIGVRKVLGASVLNLWGLLSKDFVVLVAIAFFIATPIAYYFLANWLQKYDYHTELSWWIFAVSGAGALVITLLTVSFQSIKAALMNPVNSLRSE